MKAHSCKDFIRWDLVSKSKFPVWLPYGFPKKACAKNGARGGATGGPGGATGGHRLLLPAAGRSAGRSNWGSGEGRGEARNRRRKEGEGSAKEGGLTGGGESKRHGWGGAGSGRESGLREEESCGKSIGMTGWRQRFGNSAALWGGGIWVEMTIQFQWLILWQPYKLNPEFINEIRQIRPK